MVGIYKITSPSGRIYVGQSVDTVRRFKEYRNLEQIKSQSRLHGSFIKYGVSKHIFEVIEKCRVEELNERERYWQDYYNVLGEGLNCKLTEAQDKSGKLSDNTKELIRIRSRYKNNKPVYQFTLEGDLLRMHESTLAAGRFLGDVKKSSSISSCCTGRQSTAFGYIWSYLDYIKAPAKITHQHGKTVLQLDLVEDFIKEYSSPAAAAKEYGKSVYDCLTGKQKSAYGFIWKYAN